MPVLSGTFTAAAIVASAAVVIIVMTSGASSVVAGSMGAASSAASDGAASGAAASGSTAGGMMMLIFSTQFITLLGTLVKSDDSQNTQRRLLVDFNKTDINKTQDKFERFEDFAEQFSWSNLQMGGETHNTEDKFFHNLSVTIVLLVSVAVLHFGASKFVAHRNDAARTSNPFAEPSFPGIMRPPPPEPRKISSLSGMMLTVAQLLHMGVCQTSIAAAADESCGIAVRLLAAAVFLLFPVGLAVFCTLIVWQSTTYDPLHCMLRLQLILHAPGEIQFSSQLPDKEIHAPEEVLAFKTALRKSMADVRRDPSRFERLKATLPSFLPTIDLLTHDGVSVLDSNTQGNWYTTSKPPVFVAAPSLRHEITTHTHALTPLLFECDRTAHSANARKFLDLYKDLFVNSNEAGRFSVVLVFWQSALVSLVTATGGTELAILLTCATVLVQTIYGISPHLHFGDIRLGASNDIQQNYVSLAANLGSLVTLSCPNSQCRRNQFADIVFPFPSNLLSKSNGVQQNLTRQ